MIVVKPIKPSKFNDQAIYAALAAEAEKCANDMLLDFELTTATWDHQVKFEKEVQVGPKSIEILVGTDDEIYGYVDKGTRPHDIYPRNARVLAFPSGYAAKTRPGVPSSNSGGPSGSTVFAAFVHHPGTEPRNFDIIIQKDWQPKFQKRMQAAMQAGAKASGHSIQE